VTGPHARRITPAGARHMVALAARTVTGALSALVLVACGPAIGRATAEPAGDNPITEQHAHIAGEPGGNEVDLAIRSLRAGNQRGGGDGRGDDGVGYTFEPVSRAAGDGTPDPCAQAGGQAVDVLRQPPNPAGAPTAPIMTACLTRELVAIAAGAPGISAAQAAELLRRVRLPGGTIRAAPGGLGLAGLDSYFRLEGAVQPPVDLSLGGAVLHAEFTVTGYRWSFGDGTILESRSPGIPHTYQRGGRYTVAVETTWSARGFLGSTPIAAVDGLVSGASVPYPVQEVYSLLTG
jgi:PKD domain